MGGRIVTAEIPALVIADERIEWGVTWEDGEVAVFANEDAARLFVRSLNRSPCVVSRRVITTTWTEQ